jgi:membrane protein implicated in regulation of membrane protease activity
MTDMIASMGSWNWLILGFILIGLELMAPGIFLFWLGLAALMVGGLSMVTEPSWQAQMLAFALFAISAVPLWRHFARAKSDTPFLNRRADALVGREFTLEKPIVDGVGTVRIDDTIWRISGPDTAAGSRIRIIQADGANLTVAAA